MCGCFAGPELTSLFLSEVLVPLRRPFFQPYHLIIVQDGDPTKTISVPEGKQGLQLLSVG